LREDRVGSNRPGPGAIKCCPDEVLREVKVLGFSNRRRDLALIARTYGEISSAASAEENRNDLKDDAPNAGHRFSLATALACLALAGTFIMSHRAPLPAAALAVFAAAVISSVVGFAFSAIAACLLLRVIPDKIVAIEVMLISSIAIQTYCVAALVPQIRLRRLTWFVVGGMIALPIGVYALLHLDAGAYNTLIGLILVVYGGITVLLPIYEVKSLGSWGDLIAGAIGGITGPLAAFPGACTVVWCGMRGWNKEIQRSVYQPYILIMQIATMACLSVAGEVGRLDLTYAIFAVPGILGAYVGFSVFGKLTNPQFRVFVAVLLIISGLSMVGT
jgi:uncharacterized membrane protein YfcA